MKIKYTREEKVFVDEIQKPDISEAWIISGHAMCARYQGTPVESKCTEVLTTCNEGFANLVLERVYRCMCQISQSGRWTRHLGRQRPFLLSRQPCAEGTQTPTFNWKYTW
jgi:hypothetical protein